MIRKRQIFLTYIAAALMVLLWPAGAQAQCVSGIPCITDKTEINPQTPIIEPNVGGPNAPKSERDACDADFMNQIYGRAFLEAEREVVLNQTILRKPDSVLEYTCFDQQASMVANAADLIFSGTNAWRNRAVRIDGVIYNVPIPFVIIDVWLGADFMNNSINRLVMDALTQYISSSFWHDFLGGAATGLNNTLQPAVGPPSYNCDLMDMVHFVAKCNNFMIEDQFFTFEELTQTDPRLLPQQCGGTAITQPIINLSQNRNNRFVDIDLFDRLYFEKLDAGTCGAPIPTGVMVSRQRRTVDILGNVTTEADPSYEQMVCSNPACFYDRQDSVCCLNYDHQRECCPDENGRCP